MPKNKYKFRPVRRLFLRQCTQVEKDNTKTELRDNKRKKVEKNIFVFKLKSNYKSFLYQF